MASETILCLLFTWPFVVFGATGIDLVMNFFLSLAILQEALGWHSEISKATGMAASLALLGT